MRVNAVLLAVLCKRRLRDVHHYMSRYPGQVLPIGEGETFTRTFSEWRPELTAVPVNSNALS